MAENKPQKGESKRSGVRKRTPAEKADKPRSPRKPAAKRKASSGSSAQKRKASSGSSAQRRKAPAPSNVSSIKESNPAQPILQKRQKKSRPWGVIFLVAIVAFAGGYLFYPVINAASAVVQEAIAPSSQNDQASAPPAQPTPTEEESEVLAPEPTEEPTAEPTEEPTEEPTAEPTEEPTEEPTAVPTEEPTEAPYVNMCTGVPNITQVDRGTMFNIPAPGIEDGIYPAVVNNYLEIECETDPDYPGRLFCISSRLSGGGSIAISDQAGNLVCDFDFIIP